LPAARPSRQASQAPLLRFLSLQRSPVHVALNRKCHFRFDPATALSFCPCGFSRRFACAGRHRLPRLSQSLPLRLIRHCAYLIARRTRSARRHPHGLVEPAKVRRRSWGSITLRSFQLIRGSRDLFGRAQPTCRFLNAAPVFLPGDQPVSHRLQFEADQGHSPRLLGFPADNPGRRLSRATPLLP
jgi:hypothetical protein